MHPFGLLLAIAIVVNPFSKQEAQDWRVSGFCWAPEWREPYDCGPLTAYCIAKIHGVNVELAQVKKALPIESPAGVSCFQIESFLQTNGLNYKTGWLDSSSLNELAFPVIVHLQVSGINHFVVLLEYQSEDDQFTILDPAASSIRKLNGQGLRLTATGYVIYQSPTLASFFATFATSLVLVFCLGMIGVRVGPQLAKLSQSGFGKTSVSE